MRMSKTLNTDIEGHAYLLMNAITWQQPVFVQPATNAATLQRIMQPSGE
jgi:hypothetical protein